MTAFSDAVDVLFEDENLSTGAVYVPALGDPHEARLIFRSPGGEAGFGRIEFRGDEISADVRMAEVAEPAKADRILIGATEYKVVERPVADRRRLVWNLSLREVPVA